MRVVETVGSVSSGRFARVYRDSEWNEYRVRFFRGGKYESAADYHTDDKQDALDTATFVIGTVH